MTPDDKTYLDDCIRYAAKRITRYRSREDYEDARQIIAARTYRIIGRFDPARAGWHTFVSCCVRNAAIDVCRKMKRDRRPQPLQQSVCDDSFIRELALLPDQLREVCVLIVSGFTFGQIRDRLAISPDEWDAILSQLREIFRDWR